jgi:hypothetical protein
MVAKQQHTRLTWAGRMLGIGLGGCCAAPDPAVTPHVDQSGQLPGDDRGRVAGQYLLGWDLPRRDLRLYRRRADSPVERGPQHHASWSIKLLLGLVLMGWGSFNLGEGIVDHQILGIHHVNETAPVA